MPPKLIDRRRLLVSSLGLPLLSMSAARAATIAEPVGFPDGVTFLTSGPAHGYISGWAKLLGPYLLQGLPRGTAARHDDMGGPDGVTVANAFGLRIAPDGATLMFAPGAALLAWLRGDGRVKFDPGHWIAIVAGVTPAVLVGRGPLMRGSQPVRLAATNPVGPELAALLALDLLGIRAVPAPTAPTLDYIGQALRGGSIDYALVSGPKVRGARKPPQPGHRAAYDPWSYRGGWHGGSRPSAAIRADAERISQSERDCADGHAPGGL